MLLISSRPDCCGEGAPKSSPNQHRPNATVSRAVQPNTSSSILCPQVRSSVGPPGGKCGRSCGPTAASVLSAPRCGRRLWGTLRGFGPLPLCLEVRRWRIFPSHFPLPAAGARELLFPPSVPAAQPSLCPRRFKRF